MILPRDLQVLISLPEPQRNAIQMMEFTRERKGRNNCFCRLTRSSGSFIERNRERGRVRRSGVLNLWDSQSIPVSLSQVGLTSEMREEWLLWEGRRLVLTG